MGRLAVFVYALPFRIIGPKLAMSSPGGWAVAAVDWREDHAETVGAIISTGSRSGTSPLPSCKR